MSSVDKVTDAVLLELENEGFEDQNRVTEVNLQKTKNVWWINLHLDLQRIHLNHKFHFHPPRSPMWKLLILILHVICTDVGLKGEGWHKFSSSQPKLRKRGSELYTDFFSLQTKLRRVLWDAFSFFCSFILIHTTEYRCFLALRASAEKKCMRLRSITLLQNSLF